MTHPHDDFDLRGNDVDLHLQPLETPIVLSLPGNGIL